MKLQGDALEYVAGAYVLGTLPPRARRRFAALLQQDVNVRRAWWQWEQRLADLALDVPPVRPQPGTLPAILARMQPRGAQRARMSPRRWALVAALVLGVAVAVVMMRLPSGAAPAYTAAIHDTSGGLLWNISATRTLEQLEVRALRAGAVPATRDYELWALLPGGRAPVSLGLVPRAGRARLPLSSAQQAAVMAAAQLALSDEPPGGSRTGAPTGAVLYVVDLVRAAG